MVGSERVARHVAAFGEAVAAGDWDGFAQRFAEDAEMVFVGVPAGPFAGRPAIAAAYAADPPAEPLVLTGPVTADGDEAVAPFRWADSGGTGSLRLRFDGAGRVARLVVSFD
ncbi:nuclear transport factor 2 family protein [Nocardioides sp. GXQ0305]|uniref:nuclear transport factor 2 family protein n=1 Tax=Nocardioides sp. GXQ0305 TaxID=3423912 RepID=UPI003D7E8A79